MCATAFFVTWVLAVLPLGLDDPDPPQLIPQPASLTLTSGQFDISAATSIACEARNEAVLDVGRLLAESLAKGFGRAPGLRKVAGADPLRDTILLTTLGADPELGEEGYTLDVTSATIVLRARSAQGLFRGTQTLRQLLPAGFESGLSSGATPARVVLPLVSIRDEPRYPWRGLLLDCGRHFMSVAYLKRTIDLLAYHRMNVLHWHLVEDQGWRLELERYPRLTEVGAWRGEGEQRYGGFYTREEVQDIVAYAARRHVTVVPEIELPGHCVAALAAYPELGCGDEPLAVSTRWGVHADVYCAGKESTFEFLEGVLEETLELFPSEFIHIGGDEVPKTRWEQCDDCQARMQAEGLADEDELQSWFIRRIDAWLTERGRRLVGWDEILEGGLAQGAAVQSWRGMAGAIEAARQGHDVISSPTSHCYLDYSHEQISLEKIYSFEPTPAALSEQEAAHILGAEGNMWTEYAPQERVDSMVWPRLCALAEVTWSPASQRSFYDFYGRMRTHYVRLDALGVDYHLSAPTLSAPERVFVDSLEIRFDNPVGRGVLRYTLDGSEPGTTSRAYVRNPILWRDTLVRAAVFLPDGRRSEPGRWTFRKQDPLAAVERFGLQAGLDFAAYEGHWEQLPDMSLLQPIATGTCERPDITLAGRDDGFALSFEGYLSVPEDGIWSFLLSSDDGSKLWLGGGLVVDHDGLHGTSTRVGQRMLKAGLHKLRLDVFESGGDESLGLHWQGPGMSKPEPIPDAAWGRAAGPRPSGGRRSAGDAGSGAPTEKRTEEPPMSSAFDPSYQSLPEPPAEVSAVNILARLLDGMAFRYRWAVEGLTSDDLAFTPGHGAMPLGELLLHMRQLVCWVGDNVQAGRASDEPVVWSDAGTALDDPGDDPGVLAEQTLATIVSLRGDLLALGDGGLGVVRLLGSSGPDTRPFWNAINGPMADFLTHVGQVNSWRRLMGRPGPRVDVFRGRPPRTA